MKKGDVIGGYLLLQDFTTVGGGLSKWAFAAKDGKEHFLKEFLAPTYPTPGSPGSEKTKIAKRRECEAFEAHHLLLIEKLSLRSSGGGNLIVTTDFFRYGAKYYKVTDKVDVSTLRPAQISKLTWDKQKLILLTVAHSLQILHTESVVHGDLKPDNILIKETAKGGFVAKLIDFDNSYVSGEPPVTGSEIVGDQVYYSPEVLQFITHQKSSDARKLQLASDIFALGLIYTEYLTGKLPKFDIGRYQYPAEAVLDGRTLSVPELAEPLLSLLPRMLHAEHTRRPPVREVFETIKSTDTAKPAHGRLGGTLIKRPVATPAAGSSGALSGTLIRRKS